MSVGIIRSIQAFSETIAERQQIMVIARKKIQRRRPDLTVESGWRSTRTASPLPYMQTRRIMSRLFDQVVLEWNATDSLTGTIGMWRSLTLRPRSTSSPAGSRNSSLNPDSSRKKSLRTAMLQEHPHGSMSMYRGMSKHFTNGVDLTTFQYQLSSP